MVILPWFDWYCQSAAYPMPTEDDDEAPGGKVAAESPVPRGAQSQIPELGWNGDTVFLNPGLGQVPGDRSKSVP